MNPLNRSDGGVSRPKAAVATLGCRLNQADSALLLDALERAGFESASLDEPGLAVVIVNSCSVTNDAAASSRQALRALRRRHPDALFCATGCGVSVEPEFWIDPGLVDIAVPNSEKHSAPERVARLLGLSSAMDSSAPPEGRSGVNFIIPAVGRHSGRARATLKIQDGCDRSCAYCVVPKGRGPPRSRDWNDILREFRALLEAGYREVVLAGVNINLYGDEGRSAADLVARLASEPGDFRVRLGSLEPNSENERLLALLTREPKLCRHLHIPVQSGCDAVLSRMSRPPDSAASGEFLRRAAAAVPGICLGVDLIVGFPGETDAMSAESLAWVASLPIAYIHVFPFSPRGGTPAAEMPGQVPGPVKRARRLAAEALSEKLSQAFVESQRGNRLRCVVERDGRCLSDNFIEIAPDTPALPWKSLVDLDVAEWTGRRTAVGRLAMDGA